jgi:hypothetical protein
LYDVSSTYFEGHACPLAHYGYSRDGKRDKLQITFGLLTNAEGCPLAVEVFEGNTADPQTLSAIIAKLRQQVALKQVVLVGDRGMITSARIREELAPAEGLAGSVHCARRTFNLCCRVARSSSPCSINASRPRSRIQPIPTNA